LLLSSPSSGTTSVLLGPARRDDSGEPSL